MWAVRPFAGFSLLPVLSFDGGVSVLNVALFVGDFVPGEESRLVEFDLWQGDALLLSASDPCFLALGLVCLKTIFLQLRFIDTLFLQEPKVRA